MSESAILSQVALGHGPMFDRQRALSATRLTVFPLQTDAPPEAAALLDTLLERWPGEGEPPLLLNLAGEALLHDMLAARPPKHVMLEVPSFMAVQPDLLPLLQALHAQGSTLLLKGRAELSAPVRACFRQALVEAGEGAGEAQGLPFVRGGVRRASEVAAAFNGGAAAVLGWPIEESVAKSGGKVAAPDLKVIVELMNRVDREEPIDRLEAVLKNDPTLAFRLVRYINSAAFGLRVEIGSFRHAIMMLGYTKLKRWLALLLASAGGDKDMQPLLMAAVRRALMMEELARGAGDEQTGNELFICGVFSLLDTMLGQPFDQLLKSIPVPQGVLDALVHGNGRYAPYLELARAVESESPFGIGDSTEALMLAPAEVNRALLRALVAARQLQ